MALLSVTACNDTPAVDEPVKPEDEEKYIQEARSLLNIKDNFRKIIITYDYGRKHYTDDGIIIMNIFDFLLDPDSLNY